MILKRDASETCNKYISDTSGTIIGKFCFAVVRVEGMNASYNLLRIARNIDEAGNDLDQLDPLSTVKLKLLPIRENDHNKGLKRPTGFFRKPPLQKGRDRLQEKLHPFLQEFDGPEGISQLLDRLLIVNEIETGDDLVVMVLNEGELDLYLNFACSAMFHNISLKNVLVFTGNT